LQQTGPPEIAKGGLSGPVEVPERETAVGHENRPEGVEEFFDVLVSAAGIKLARCLTGEESIDYA
jgi:hypothetical protein